MLGRSFGRHKSGWIMVVLLLLLWGCGAKMPSITKARVDGNMYRDPTVDYKAQRIGVLNFASPGTSGQWAADMIATELLFDGFDVLERHHISNLIGEQTDSLLRQLEGRDNRAAVKEIGRMLGVDLLMVGAVTFFGYDQIRGAAAVGLTARLIEVSTGRICWTLSASRRTGSLQTAMYGVCLAVKESLIQDKVYVWQRG